MTSFGWKRKAGAKVTRSQAEAFSSAAADDGEDAAVKAGDVDWLTLAPQKKAMVLEDAIAKSNRLKQEGVILAESERFWEALRKWDQALQLTPNCEKLLEMKAQAYLHLNELLPALSASERVTDLRPLWWVGHQTLGRARLGLGEVRMAIKAFSRAIHLYPADEELWQEDLKWSAELLAKKRAIEKQALEAAEHEAKPKIVELDTDGTTSDSHEHVSKEIVKVNEHGTDSCGAQDSHTGADVRRLPGNYVYMKD